MFLKFIFFLALFSLLTSVSFSQKTKTFQSATGKYGLLSKKGDTLVQPLYDNIYDFDKNGLAFFRLNKKFGVMDKTGKQIIKPNYDYIRRYSQYFIVFQGERKYYTEKGIYGLLNADGSELLPLSFQKMEVWNNHLLLIKDEKHGVLNSKGQFSVPLVYDFMQTNFYSKYLKVAINGLHGYIDASNKEVIPIEFASVSQIYNNKVIVKKDGKYGMMAVGGKWTIDLQFEELNFASEGLSLAKLSGKYGYVDKNGKMVLDFIYDDAYDFNNHYAVAQDDKSLFLIDKKGKRLLSRQL